MAIRYQTPALLVFACLAMAVLSSPCLAQGKADSDRKCVFAGFAFSGDYAHRESLYPHTAEIEEKDSPGLLDTLLREKILKNPSAAARLSFEKANDKTDVTSIAFALTHETVEVQSIDGKLWIIVVLQANVLAFNKATSSVVAAIPLRMRYTRVVSAQPTRRDIKQIVREAYTTAIEKECILDQWVGKINSMVLKKGATKYLRVTEIAIKPEAEAALQKAKVAVPAFKGQVASLLEASIAENAGVAIVPNTAGEAIGAKMMLRFANASALQLTLPEADYGIVLTVRDFVSKTLDNQGHFQDIFRVKAGIAIRQPDSGRTYMDENIYDTNIVVRPKEAQVQIDDWAQYYKLLQQLVSSLGKQLIKNDDDWLKEKASRALEAKSAFMQVNKLMREMP